MPTVHMMIGNIGSGKSELSKHLAKKLGASIVNMDAITESIHGDYGMYNPAMKETYHDVEETLIESSLKAGVDVIIDRTNVDLKRRKRFVDIAKQYTDEISAYNFGVGAKDIFVKRRMKDPRGVPRETWMNVLRNMCDNYEAPAKEEGFSDIYDVADSRHEFLAVDFDGTIVGQDFPDIGDPIDETISFMREFWRKSLFHRIIIWSCRSGDYQAEMKACLLKNKVPFDFINENPIVDFGSPKIFAHQYMDDRNIPMIGEK